MLRVLKDMPPAVLGFEAVGDVEPRDYELVLVPAVENAIAEHGKARLVVVLGRELDDYEAFLEDLKLGARHPAGFERIAVVTDAGWARPAAKLAGALMPGKLQAFGLDELDAAKRWAAE
jgi:hypothetical protein